MRLTNRLILFVLALSLGAIGIAAFLVPSHKELALMEMNDRDFKTALNTYLNLSNAGDHSINVLAPLITLDVYYGDIDKSIDLLKPYVDDHPHSIEGLKRLAELYKSSQRFNSYCQKLEELQNLSPSPSHLRELINTYDFLGRYRDEMNALVRLVASKDYKPVDEDYTRLALFYHANRQEDKATQLLSDYVKDQSYTVKSDVVYLNISLLLEQNKPEMAFSLGKTYIKKHGTDADAISFASLFEKNGFYDPAYDLLKPYLAALDQSPDLEQQIISLLLAQKKDEEAFRILYAQYQRGALPLTNTATLINLAIKRSDYDFVENVLKKTAIASLPEDELLTLAGLAGQIKRPNLATLIHNRLDASYLNNAPLLNAVLNIAAQDNPGTLQAVLDLPPGLVVSTTSRIVIAEIYLSHNLYKAAFNLLKPTPVTDLLDKMGATNIATLYLNANAADEGAHILDQARQTSPSDSQTTINNAIMLLNVGQGKTDAVRHGIEQYTNKDTAVFSDALAIALHFHRDELAIDFAQRLYQAAPDTLNKLRLADALLRTGRFSDALPFLEVPPEKDAEALALYIDTIDDWIQRSGSLKLPEAQKQAFLKSLLQAALNPNLTSSETIRFAYILEEAGFRNEAEKAFVKAAGSQPHNSHDVGELLDFWQSNPTASSMEWIKNHAQKTSGGERIFWLTTLNNMGYSQAVLSVVQNDWGTSPQMTDIYVTALINNHDKLRLEEVLNQIIAVESNKNRLGSSPPTRSGSSRITPQPCSQSERLPGNAQRSLAPPSHRATHE